MAEEKDKYLLTELRLSDDKSSCPIVCNFPMNKPLLEDLNETKFLHVFKKNNRHEYKLAGERNNVLFEGKNKSAALDNQKFLIGVFNKSKRLLTFCDTQVISVNQVTKVNDETNIVLNQAIPSYNESKSLLVQDFGTTKSKKVNDSMKSNIVNEENISSVKAMHYILNKKTKQEEEQVKLNQVNGVMTSEQSMKSILPSFNLATNKIFEVFDLTDSKITIYKLINIIY